MSTEFGIEVPSIDNKDVVIKNIITCGIRWGSGNPSFAELSLKNNIAILGGNNKNFNIIEGAKSGTLIALKNGFNIIALGMYKNQSEEITWSEVFDTYIRSENRKYTEDKKAELADKYYFDLKEKVVAIEVEEWVILDPPIYYSMRMSTVSIRQDHVIKECNDRFKQGQLDTEQLDTKQYNNQLAQFNIQTAQGLLNTLNSEDISEDLKEDDEKRKILENALELIKKAQKLDPTNKDATNLKNAIESDPIFKKEQEQKEQMKEKKDTISNIHKISWGVSGIGLLILIANRIGLYALTVNRMIFMGGILIVLFVPYITSLKFGGLDISLEDKKDKK